MFAVCGCSFAVAAFTGGAIFKALKCLPCNLPYHFSSSIKQTTKPQGWMGGPVWGMDALLDKSAHAQKNFFFKTHEDDSYRENTGSAKRICLKMGLF